MFDTSGQDLASDENGGPRRGARIEYKSESTGTLFVQVRGFSGTGTYTLSVIRTRAASLRPGVFHSPAPICGTGIPR